MAGYLCASHSSQKSSEEQYGMNGCAVMKGTRFFLFEQPPFVFSLFFSRMCDIPEETRVCITLMARRDGRNDYPLGHVNYRLFNFKDHLLSG